MASPSRRPWFVRFWLGVGVVWLGLSASTADAGWFDSLMKSERADLRLEIFTLNKRSAAVGETLIASVEVSNWGNLRAKSTRLTILAAPGASSSIGQASQVYTMDLGTMGPKVRQRYSATFAVPAWAKTGTYSVFATVESRAIESRRGNNTIATNLDVTGSSSIGGASPSLPVGNVADSGVSCDYYASPRGASTNDGLTSDRPFRPQDFWAVAKPGRTLCLMDGVYRGAAFMLDPSSQGAAQPQGSSGSFITIRALNEGRVLIDGQGTNRPVAFASPAKWYIVEGINACCSGSRVIGPGNSTDWIIRRVVAWDSAGFGRGESPMRRRP
jgi:hypothetical protein